MLLVNGASEERWRDFMKNPEKSLSYSGAMCLLLMPLDGFIANNSDSF